MLFEPFFHLRKIRQGPVQLRTREIGGKGKACLLAIPFLVVRVCKIMNHLVSSAIHPNDCVVDWETGILVPDDQCFALVRDPNGSQIR